MTSRCTKPFGGPFAFFLCLEVQRNPLQDDFVKLVTLREEKQEMVKMKCWAGWASEDKMRDILKIKEPDT